MTAKTKAGSFELPVVQAPDLDAAEILRMQTWHDESRFYRGVQRRRARAVARFAQDAATIRKATRFHPQAFGDRRIDLDLPSARSLAVNNLFAHRVSTARSRLAGAVTIADLAELLALAVRPTRFVTGPVGDAKFALRPYPSAGALYPCDIYAVLNDGPDANRPLRYEAYGHQLVDYGAECREFRTIEMEAHDVSPPCALIIAATLSRSTTKYGPRGYRFALLEAGHLSQNFILAATALGLASLVSGSYFDAEIERWLGLDGLDEVVLSTVLVGGKPKSNQPFGA